MGAKDEEKVKDRDNIELDSCGDHPSEDFAECSFEPRETGRCAVDMKHKSDIFILRRALRILRGEDDPETVKTLLSRFGSLTGLCTASIGEIASVGGITERTAGFFTVMEAAFRQALLRKTEEMNNEYSLVRYGIGKYYSLEYYEETVLYIDGNFGVIKAERLPLAGKVREMANGICKTGARRVAVLCNNPYGAGRLGVERLKEIARTVRSVESLGAEYIDYIELGRYEYYSVRKAVNGEKPTEKMTNIQDREYTDLKDLYEKLTAYISSRGNGNE